MSEKRANMSMFTCRAGFAADVCPGPVGVADRTRGLPCWECWAVGRASGF